MSARAAVLQRAQAILQEAGILVASELVAELAGEAPANDPPYLSPNAFAARMGVGRSTVYRLMAKGMPFDLVRGTLERGTRRIPVALAEAWIAARPDAEQPPPLDHGPRAVP
jgi:hypothetical protein